MSRRPNGRLKTFLRTISLNWQPIVVWTLITGLLFWNWSFVSDNRQTIFQILGMIFQLLFAMLFLIIQFVALFWFLAKPRLYWVDPGETGISFADYKGNKEILEVAWRVVTLIKGVKKFKQMGGEVSRGLLMVGPPGTGKSYLAQAIATEAGVPFAYASAPSFQSMFMGIAPLTVKNLYRTARKKARKYGACIIFIDEIDAIGGARSSNMAGGGGFGLMGGFMGGGAGSGLLNELLMQMDPPPIETGLLNRLLRKLGLRTRRAERPVILTMGATNLPEALDQALLRPGRFDRRITIDRPDFDGRKEVLHYYLEKVKHDANMPIDRMAGDTVYYTPADIKHVVNEAVIHAHFDGRTSINYRDFSLAREVHEWGLRQPIRSMSAEDKRRIAYHEAGHAVAAYLLLPAHTRPVKATIIRHERALGFVAPKPTEERYTRTREEILADIQVSLASRAAERLFLGTELTGVYGDLQQATRAAAAYLGLVGMGGSLFSYAAFGNNNPDGELKRDIERLLDEQYQRVQRLLQENRDAVVAIAEGLLEREELDRDEISELIDHARPETPGIAAYDPGRSKW